MWVSVRTSHGCTQQISSVTYGKACRASLLNNVSHVSRQVCLGSIVWKWRFDSQTCCKSWATASLYVQSFRQWALSTLMSVVLVQPCMICMVWHLLSLICQVKPLECTCGRPILSVQSLSRLFRASNFQKDVLSFCRVERRLALRPSTSVCMETWRGALVQGYGFEVLSEEEQGLEWRGKKFLHQASFY